MKSSLSPNAQDEGLAELVRRAQNGSNDAAQQLFDRCRLPLLNAIRKVITRPIRRLYDSEDFLLAAFRQIFTRHFSEEVLASPQILWPYIKRIAENQVRDAQRKYLLSQRHKITDELSLELLKAEEALQSNDLSAEEHLMLKELVEDRLMDLLQQLPTMLGQIVVLILDGNKADEIASRLKVEPKRIDRAMAWLKKQVMQSPSHLERPADATP